MQKFLMLVLILLSTSVLSAWRKQCLNECFSTGHDCNYCAYQCEVDDYYKPKPNYSGDVVCPLYDNEYYY